MNQDTITRIANFPTYATFKMRAFTGDTTLFGMLIIHGVYCYAHAEDWDSLVYELNKQLGIIRDTVVRVRLFPDDFNKLEV